MSLLKNIWFDRILMTSALVIMIAVLFDLLGYLLRDTRPPIEVRAMEVLNSPVHFGEDLLVRIYREKYRDCPLVGYRYVLDKDGRRFDLPDEAKPGGGPIGSDYVDVLFPLVDLPIGRYTFFSTVTYYCDGDVFVISHPPVDFRMLPGSDPNITE